MYVFGCPNEMHLLDMLEKLNGSILTKLLWSESVIGCRRHILAKGKEQLESQVARARSLLCGRQATESSSSGDLTLSVAPQHRIFFFEKQFVVPFSPDTPKENGHYEVSSTTDKLFDALLYPGGLERTDTPWRSMKSRKNQQFKKVRRKWTPEEEVSRRFFSIFVQYAVLITMTVSFSEVSHRKDLVVDSKPNEDANFRKNLALPKIFRGRTQRTP